MKLFEFYFNPKVQEHRALEIFFFEPKNPAEKERGVLVMAGDLRNTLPSNEKLLKRISKTVRDEYYDYQTKGKREPTPEACLKSALKKANAFLAKEAKDGNINWQGNLHIAAFAVKPVSDIYSTLHFTKTGDIGVWLVRNGKFVDMAEGIKQPSTAKVFGNIGGGKIMAGDKVILVTQEVEEAWTKEKVWDELAFFRGDKRIQKLFKEKEKKLSNIPGLIALLLMDIPGGEKKVTSSKKLLARPVPLPDKEIVTYWSLIPLRLIAGILYKISTIPTAWKRIFVGSFLVGLTALAAYLIFVPEQEPQGPTEQEIFTERFLESSGTIIEQPEAVASFEEGRDIFLRENQLIVSHENAVTILDTRSQEMETITSPHTLSKGTQFEGNIHFFTDTDTLLSLNSDSSWQETSLETDTVNKEIMASYYGNIYTINKETGAILRYPPQASSSTTWSQNDHGDTLDLAVDGSIWTLENGSFSRYYLGEHEETFTPSLFPTLEKASLIQTSDAMEDIYIMDTENNRLVIMSKNGELISQIYSETFDNLLGMSISPNENTAFLLNENTVYRVPLDS